MAGPIISFDVVQLMTACKTALLHFVGLLTLDRSMHKCEANDEKTSTQCQMLFQAAEYNLQQRVAH